MIKPDGKKPDEVVLGGCDIATTQVYMNGAPLPVPTGIPNEVRENGGTFKLDAFLTPYTVTVVPMRTPHNPTLKPSWVFFWEERKMYITTPIPDRSTAPKPFFWTFVKKQLGLPTTQTDDVDASVLATFIAKFLDREVMVRQDLRGKGQGPDDLR